MTCKCPLCKGTGKVVIRESYTEINKPLAKKLRAAGCTIRQIAEALGYKHPGSISHLLKD